MAQRQSEWHTQSPDDLDMWAVQRQRGRAHTKTHLLLSQVGPVHLEVHLHTQRHPTQQQGGSTHSTRHQQRRGIDATGTAVRQQYRLQRASSAVAAPQRHSPHPAPYPPHISRLPPVWQARSASTQSSSSACSSPAMSSTVGLEAATGSVRHSAACEWAGGSRAGGG